MSWRDNICCSYYDAAILAVAIVLSWLGIYLWATSDRE